MALLWVFIGLLVVNVFVFMISLAYNARKHVHIPKKH